MILAKVIKPLVTTIKFDDLKHEKLVLVRAGDLNNKSLSGAPFWVVDRLGVSVGDWVLVLAEGGSVGMLLNKSIPNYINGIVAGIVESGHEHILES